MVATPAETVRHAISSSFTEAQLRRNFWWMAACFAVNHGAVTTPLVVSTTLLGKNCANVGNGLLYLATLLSSLFIGAPTVSKLGPKTGILIGMSLYCVYIAGFSLAALFKDVEALTWLFFLAGSISGGLAAGVLWTAQGSYFGGTATLLAEKTGEGREALTASLAGNFAFIYLVLEVGCKFAFSGLQALDWEPWVIGVVFFIVGAISLALMTVTYSLGTAADKGATVSVFSKATAVVSLWRDPAVWLLAPTNLAFGFSAAFMNGHVNRVYAAEELGDEFVPFLAAITALSAALLAKVYGPLGRMFGKGPVLVAGAVSFLCIPLCLWVLGCCDNWGWALVALYLLQGSGRGVYESTNRAVFSDFFTGPATEGAFANCMLQASLSFAICFFLQTAFTGRAIGAMIMVLAVLTPLGFAVAKFLRRGRAVGNLPSKDSEPGATEAQEEDSEAQSEQQV